jgi:hypothetical protein
MLKSINSEIDLKKLITLFFFFLILNSIGCANPYANFYFDLTGGADLTTAPNVVLSNDEPRLTRGSNPDDDFINMLESGYSCIGYSSFNAGNVSDYGAISQAKQVHAEIVLYYSKYSNTVSGSLPLTVPNTQTSSTTYGGSVYGNRGYSGRYSGTATTKTYGSDTVYVPYSVNRYDYFASYWVKDSPPIFGTHVRDLTPELRRKIGSNKGLLIIAVINGSPAFNADILGGDILKTIDDIEIFNIENFQEALERYAGREVFVTIFREDKEIVKKIKLNGPEIKQPIEQVPE